MSVQTPEESVPVVPPPDAHAGWRIALDYYLRLLGLRGRGLALLGGLLGILWIMSGIYKVQPDEQGVVLRFGQWVRSADPGLHYRLPWPFESLLLPKVTQIKQIKLTNWYDDKQSDTSDILDEQMLTGDENIVEAECTVFWRIKDAGQFLFQVKDPETALRVAAESAMRDVIARTPIQATMAQGRQQVAEQTAELLQQWLDEERAGILITQVQLQRVDPPVQVIDAFNDVQRARADQERARNEAQAYSNDIIPRARGEADRLLQEANAYKTQSIDLAKGEASRFDALYQSYSEAREVTAWRLYMESMDALLKKAGKVIVDSSGNRLGGVVPYLPLQDKAPAVTQEVH